MIKINLIYDRKLVELNKIKTEFYLAIFLTVFVLVVIFFIWNLNNRKFDEIVKEVSDAEIRKSQLASVEKKIKQFEDIKAKIDRRINAISLLIDQKKGPARIFDELNTILPDEIWLTSVSLKGTIMQIEGYSYTDPGIARFMENLKSGTYFSDVNLEGINLQDVNGEFFKKFTLNSEISLSNKDKLLLSKLTRGGGTVGGGPVGGVYGQGGLVGGMFSQESTDAYARKLAEDMKSVPRNPFVEAYKYGKLSGDQTGVPGPNIEDAQKGADRLKSEAEQKKREIEENVRKMEEER